MGSAYRKDRPARGCGVAVVTVRPAHATIEFDAARVAPESRVPYARPAAHSLLHGLTR